MFDSLLNILGRTVVLVAIAFFVQLGFELIAEIRTAAKKDIFAMRIENIMLNRGVGYLVHANNGTTLLLDPKDEMVSARILMNGEWEPQITNLLTKVVRTGQNILSIGGHIGYHAIHMGKLTGEEGTVYCFEANPTTFKLLDFNVKQNDLNNIKLFNKAAYSKKSILTMKYTSKADDGKMNTGAAFIYNDKRSDDGLGFTVESDRIDNILNEVKSIDILQMDIEGSESHAVYGASELIARSPNLIVIQEWSPSMAESRDEARKYLDFWRTKGYEIAMVYMDKLELLTNDQLLNPLIELKGTEIIMAKNLADISKLYAESTPS